MIRAVVWKELREQGLIGATLVVLGSGVLVLAASLAEPPTPGAPAADVIHSLGLGLLATLMLAVTAGMVCGGAVFAAEREAGTIFFLDALPVSRWRLWWAKLLAGVGLAAVQIALLVGVGAVLGIVPSAGWARAVSVFALLSFVWGMFGSTLSRTTLGSIGIAIPASVVAAIVVLLPIMLFSRYPGAQSIRSSEAILFLVCMFIIPLALSAWAFTSPDRLRSAEDRSAVESEGGRKASRPWLGGRALLWLALRQVRLPALVLAGFALLFGLMLIAPGSTPVVTWPALALAAGVLTGVTAFSDEQIRGVSRFWGEQRLPLGRAWFVKIGIHFLLCLGLLMLLMSPLIVRAMITDRSAFRGNSALAVVFRSNLFSELSYNGWKYLLVPAVYGFAAGHLCGLVFRKLVVACGMAGLVGGMGAAMWGPSLLSGGVKQWQLWLPPILLLITARVLISAWASDRLVTRRSLTALAAGGLASILALGIGIGYRVIEVPNQPDGERDIAYVASLLPFDQNFGGNGFRTASEQYARAASGLTSEFDVPPGATPSNRRVRIDELLNEVIVRGWPADDPNVDKLSEWLDNVFNPTTVLEDRDATSPWFELASQSAQYPIGIFEYPQLTTDRVARDVGLPAGHRMAVALLVRGLQQQQKGDPSAFVPALRTVIKLARTMRNGSTCLSFQSGIGIEHVALMTVERWLEGPRPKSEDLRAVTAILEEADPTTPFDPTPHFLAERFVIRESMKGPSEWLPRLLGIAASTTEASIPEVDLVSLSWAVPWERERTHRLGGLGYETGTPVDPGLIRGRPGAGMLLRPRIPGELIEMDVTLRGQRRAVILMTALRAYHAEQNTYPDSNQPEPLKVLLTEGYLRNRVPPDPHLESRTFGYRITPPEGETLQFPVRPQGDRTTQPGTTVRGMRRFIPGGHIILWTVGPDQRDEGGTHPPASGYGGFTSDVVYLVPMGPNS